MCSTSCGVSILKPFCVDIAAACAGCRFLAVPCRRHDRALIGVTSILLARYQNRIVEGVSLE